MTNNKYTANATINVGGSYNTNLFILGNVLPNNTVELIPKLTADQFKYVQTINKFDIQFKIYNTATKKMVQWSGNTWTIINDNNASYLVSNTASNQTLIEIDDTAPPIAGQALVATSSTKAVWYNVSGGGGITLPPQTGNGGKFLETDGTNPAWMTIPSQFPTQTGNNNKVLFTNGTNPFWSIIPSQFPSQPGNSGKFLSTDGVSPVWNIIPSQFPSQSGNNGKVLFTDGTNPIWNNIPSQFPTQAGNAGKALFTDGTTPEWDAVFPIQTGNAGKFLSTDGTNVLWGIPNFLMNPMTSFGDIIIGGTSGAAGRLGIGSNGQSLTVSGGLPQWVSIIPSLASQSGKFLSNNGTITQWQVISQVPSFVSGDAGKLLSNDGTITQWITNTTPPSVSGQAGKFLGNDGNNSIWYSINQVPSVTGQAGKLLTNDGSSYSWNTLISIMPSIVGNNGKFLTTNGTLISWAFPPTGFTNPMTAYADLIVGGVGGLGVRLGTGTTGQVLTSVNNVWDGFNYINTLQWLTPPTYLVNPMTDAGDLIVGGGSGIPTRLPGVTGSVLYSGGSSVSWTPFYPVATVNSGVSGMWLTNNGTATNWTSLPSQLPDEAGHNGQYLTTDGSAASWNTIPAGFANPMTTTGDMISASSGGVAGRIGIGITNQVLTVISGGPSWQNIPSQFPTQSGFSGEFLTTNGSSVLWSAISQVPNVSGNSGYFLGNDGLSYSWSALPNQLPSVSGQSGKYLSNNGSISTWVPYDGLPDLTGNSGKILTTDGVIAFWETPAGGGASVLGRIPIHYVSSVLDINDAEIDTVNTTCATFQLLSVTVSSPCRIRIYGTYADAVSDFARSSTTDPTNATTGLFIELIFISSVLTWTISPTVICFNNDTVETANVYITIENTGSTSTAITIDGKVLKME